MSYQKRKVLNRAAADASDESSALRSDMTDQLEELRKTGNLTPKEINEALGKSDNWYSNSIRNDRSGHDFSLKSYSEVKIFLQMVVLYMFKSGKIEKDRMDELADVGAIDSELLSADAVA